MRTQTSDQSFGLRWSVIGHGSIFLFILIKSIVFPSTPIVYVPSLRVDIVGLPDVLKKDLKIPKPLEAEEQSQEEEKPKLKTPVTPAKEQADPDELVLKPKPATENPAKRQKKMKSALARIKSLAKINSEETPQLIKGNAVSKGTSLSGDAKESSQSNYYDLVRDRLQENWSLPVWIARQHLSAQVQLFIDSRGKLYRFRFVKLSGNTQFDDAVKRTLQESQPFPPPPSELGGSALANGILVGFPL